jgi:hypothetical protein
MIINFFSILVLFFSKENYCRSCLVLNVNSSRTVELAYQERTSSEAFGNSFFPKTIRDWNQLPANTTPANTVEGFRSALKAHPDSN